MKNDSPQNGTDKIVFVFAIALSLYFSSLILLYELKIDSTIIGVFGELLTIPAVVFLLVLLIISAVSFVRGKFNMKSFPFYSLVIILTTIAVMIGFA